MNARIDDLNAIKAYESLRAGGARSRELADVLDYHKTRVYVTPRILGGLTLNFINTIFMMPLRADASDCEYKQWVALLAHEACHVEQRFWVDSVEQEIRAYTAQALVGDELGIDLGHIKRAFFDLNPARAQDLVRARAALITLFAGTPAGIVYASLPLFQPTGVRALLPALRESFAVLRAGFSRPRI